MIADTCFLIDLMNGNEQAQAKLKQLELYGEQLILSAPVVFELAIGVGKSTIDRVEEEKVQSVVRKLTKIALTHEGAYRGGILCGKLHKKNPDPLDMLIAGSALETEEILLTRNSKHFEDIDGLRIETY